MQWSEPAILDLLGASWASRDEFTLAEGAQRYESYERNFAAQVHHLGFEYYQAGFPRPLGNARQAVFVRPTKSCLVLAVSRQTRVQVP